MTKIVITDTHFGVKQNSINWLNSQLAFIYDELIPYIDTIDDQKWLIHMGDVFDSRSTISTVVASRVVEAFTELSKHVDKFVIIGGNHDYYSPASDSVDSLNLLLQNTGAELYTKEMKRYDKDLFVPWYEWLNKSAEIQSLVDAGVVDTIYTHADIVNEPSPVHGATIWSGHVHTPSMKPGLYNTGSCYPITFMDCNDQRGFYVCKGDNIKFIPNTKSISFYRIYNNEIFDEKITGKLKDNDYIELYINQFNLTKESYSEQVDKFIKTYKNIWVIPQTSQTIIEDSSIDTFSGYDIETICRKAVPESIQSKFEAVVDAVNSSKDK